jgi:protoporphyrinogen oxidase
LRPFAFRERGNQYYLERMLQLSNAKLQTHFNVVKVATEQSCVVAFGSEGQKISAAYAIVATPAPAALGILPAPSPESRRLLEASKYAGGLVAHMTFRADRWPVSAYAVAISEDVDAIVFRPHGFSDSAVVGATFYVGDEKYQRFANDTAADVQRRMLEQLQRWRLVDTANIRVLHFDYLYWPYIGPIFSRTMLAARGAEAIKAGPRILLAGDYAAFGEQTSLPYGLKAAHRSGVYAAETLRAMMSLE